MFTVTNVNRIHLNKIKQFILKSEYTVYAPSYLILIVLPLLG